MGVKGRALEIAGIAKGTGMMVTSDEFANMPPLRQRALEASVGIADEDPGSVDSTERDVTRIAEVLNGYQMSIGIHGQEVGLVEAHHDAIFT